MKQKTAVFNRKYTLFIVPILLFCLTAVFLSSCQNPHVIPRDTESRETTTPVTGETTANPETEAETPSLYIGPDGEEYFGEFHGGLFGLGTELTNLVSEEEYLQYTDKTFAGTFDFNQRSFCRYFGVTEEAYREAVSVYNWYDIYGEAGRYKAEQYPVGIFGDYEDFIDIFVREESRIGCRTEEWLPDENCVHTYTFHTITDELIDCVGEEAYKTFRQTYAGTEEFNILNFISYFYLDEKTVSDILEQSTDPIPAYNVQYLFGDEEMQREYFLIREYQSDEQTKLYYGLPTQAEFMEITDWYIYDSGMHRMICAFLRNDWETFARYCGVEPEVYSHMRNMKIGEYELKNEMIPASDDPASVNPFLVLSFEVLESTSEVFPVGEHELVWKSGLNVTFKPRETFRYTVSSPWEMSRAERYLLDLGSDRDFAPVTAENKRQFGLCDFIVGRLDVLYGNDEPRTKEEIGDYAEKYLGVDRDTLQYDKTLEKTENGYRRIGRGGGSYIYTVLSEEVRDGITVITVQFWADESKTVPSRKVEFYTELLDGEYKPLYSVIVEDSKFRTMYLST
ncbi:MAG: hypothetical protein IJ325_06795 [Clostridia bacterium]|nr:hypothetical protein [Clostridia bacterium]